jgi:hypothetical protein
VSAPLFFLSFSPTTARFRSLLISPIAHAHAQYFSFELHANTPSPLPLTSGITLSPACTIFVRAVLRE